MSNEISIGNAPCSWGTLEFAGMGGGQVPYHQMLDELRATGYSGTELGDWGYMPTDPAALKAELVKRNLGLTGAFVPVALKYPEAHAEGETQAVKVARLLAAANPLNVGKHPCIVLSDDNGSDPVRTRNAGRITPEMGLSEEEWQIFAQGANRIARAVREETGLSLVFHHHCAGYVETPQEIARFLELTDPDLVSLVLDTGHYTYGTGSNNGQAALEGLKRFRDRIWYVHFKDCHPQLADRAHQEGWDYFQAVGHGLFCELGQGQVDFPAIVNWLRDQNYQGWITVEQDVLPGLGSPYESAERNRRYLANLGL